MRLKSVGTVLIILFFCSILASAQPIQKNYRLQVLRIISTLPRVPTYTKALQLADLSRMEFAVILGRLIGEYPDLRHDVKHIIKEVSWELNKLGYKGI